MANETRIGAASLVTVAALVAALTMGGAPRLARAQDQKANSCGCYGDGAGRCFCSKQAKCGCPGECEPTGCEEKRQKAMEKEIEAETRRVQEDYRKRGSTSPAAKTPAREGKEDARPAPGRPEPKVAPVKAVVAPEPPAPASRRAKPMTAAQKKQLAQLLEAYLAECPDCGARSVEAVHHEMAGH